MRKKVEKSTAEGGKTSEKKMPRIGKEAEKGRTGGEKNQRRRLKKCNERQKKILPIRQREPEREQKRKDRR